MNNNTILYLEENTIDPRFIDGKVGLLLSDQYLNYSYFGKK